MNWDRVVPFALPMIDGDSAGSALQRPSMGSTSRVWVTDANVAPSPARMRAVTSYAPAAIAPSTTRDTYWHSPETAWPGGAWRVVSVIR